CFIKLTSRLVQLSFEQQHRTKINASGNSIRININRMLKIILRIGDAMLNPQIKGAKMLPRFGVIFCGGDGVLKKSFTVLPIGYLFSSLNAASNKHCTSANYKQVF